MSRDRRGPGFRFWWTDAATIGICGVVTWLSWPWLGRMALVFPVTLAHFFLFCNVFRIRRSYELVWTGAYLMNLGYWILLRELSWLHVLAWQTPLTVAFMVAEVRSPRYHGILWGRFKRSSQGRTEEATSS